VRIANLADPGSTEINGDHDAGNKSGDLHEQSDLSVLHWNIHCWKDADDSPNLDSVTEFVGDVRPQVVSLVEVDESWGAPLILGQMAERLGYSWLFVPAFDYWPDSPTKGFGNALLTTVPVLSFQQWPISTPELFFDGSEPSEARTIALLKLKHGGEPVWIGATHLPWSDATARQHAMRRVILITKKLHGNWIICGDFNAPESSWPSDDLSHMVFTSPASPTYPADDPAKTIDYCISSPGISLQVTTLTAKGSDHLPVLAQCQFERRT
jgi:endonuclease/exonuclease/phosphatase family metal-dependent hydrolase